MPEFDLTGELSLKIELHMLRPFTEKVHSGNGPVSLVSWSKKSPVLLLKLQFCEYVKFGAISWKIDILSITA